MATNEPNKPDNVINIDTAKTQAEEKPAPDQPLQAGGEAPAPEPEQPPVPRDATRNGETEQVVYLNISELYAFKDHPFGVRDDTEMKALVESVKNGGVNQPALVRPREGGGYEIIAGHRRQKASARWRDMSICPVSSAT